MGNVGLGVGFVTKIWRIRWEDAGTKEVSAVSEGETDGAMLRAFDQQKYCQQLAKCDPDGTLYHWIVLRHYESGKVAVYVDGALEGTGHASFSSSEVSYRVGNRVVSTRIGFNEKAKFAYTFSTSMLLPNQSQVVLKELNETLMDNHDPGILFASIPSTSVEFVSRPGQPTAKAVVLYEMSAGIRGEEPKVVKKRFSEFVDVDRMIRSAFHGSHLLSSLPSLPPRQSKLISNHLEPAFVERRRAGLELYLKKILALPRIPQNPDVLEFLGLLPSAKVSSAPPVVVV